MKLTAFILFFFALHVTAKSVSQTITLSADHMKLSQVFNAIKQQTGFSVIYGEELSRRFQTVSVKAERMPLADFLTTIAAHQFFTFSIGRKSIFLNPLPAMESVNARHFSAMYDSPPVTGIVRDEDGNILSGINITIKGSKTGTRTAADGSFLINAEVGDILIFSSVEFESQEYKLSAKEMQGKLSIDLKRKITALGQVEVNKGYYTVKEELNTGSVVTVKGADIQKQPVTDPVLALQGRVPGLSVSATSGIPGAGLNIQLRGQNFLAGASNVASPNDPLYIVDGIPFASRSILHDNSPLGVLSTPPNPGVSLAPGLSPFNLLNPADIESIVVLKDADATAIYGSRGANGVILINTKKGRPGRMAIDINQSYGFSQRTVSSKLMNTQQWLQMRHQAYDNDGLPFPSIKINPRDFNYNVNGVWDTTRYTDWEKLAMGKKATFNNTQLSISGGSANINYRVGTDYSNNRAYMPGNYGSQTGSLNFNLGSSSLNDCFHIELSGSYLYNLNKIPASIFSPTNAPDSPPFYDLNGNINWQIYNGRPTFILNPMASNYVYDRAVSTNLIGGLALSYRLTRDLSLNTNFNYNKTEVIATAISTSLSNRPPNNTDPFSRTYSFSTTANTGWNNESQLSYKRLIGSGQLETLIGTTLQHSSSNSIGYSASGFASDALISDPLAASHFSLGSYNNSQYRFVSLYARIGYNYMEKYVLNLTSRRDGSSRFGEKRQYGNFGSVGAAWIFSKEGNLHQMLPWLSFGKLRASYGTTGSDVVNDYQYLSTYDISSSTYQGVTLLNPSGLLNPYYHWGQVQKLEAGLDLGFLRDLIHVNVGWYRNRTVNQLVNYSLPLTTGFYNMTANFPGVVQNKGWEFIVNTFNVRAKDFNWSSSFNISVPQNKLVSFPGLATSGYQNTYKIGQDISSRLVSHYIGVDPQTGIYRFATSTGNGLYPSYPSDYVWSRPTTSTVYGGLDNTFNFKGFNLNFLFSFVKHLGYSYQNVFSTTGGQANKPSLILDAWKKPGEIAAIQKLTTGQGDYSATSAYGTFITSDGLIQDASYVRLQSLILSYQLPKVWLQRISFKGASIGLQGHNLLTFIARSYKVIDPETQNLMAPVKTFALNFHLTF